jgi:hypothetical protein
VCPQTGKFVPEKTNIWRDCVDGYYDWVKEHIAEGAPLNEADHCGDPPLVLAAGNGAHRCPCLPTLTRLPASSPPPPCSVAIKFECGCSWYPNP